MPLTKSFIELTPFEGYRFTSKISISKKTDLTAYVIDGTFTTSMCAPSMSGEDFQEMKELVFKQEFKDKSTPLFYFSQSKTFCINFVPLYLASYSTASASVGLFLPTVIEINNHVSSFVTAEMQYEGKPIYLIMDGIQTRATNVTKHIDNGSTIIARPIDYGYDVDSKEQTKRVSFAKSSRDDWRFGVDGRGSRKSTIKMTSDYVFKFLTCEDKINGIACNSLTADDSRTAVWHNGLSSSSLGRGSIGYAARPTHLKSSLVLSRELKINGGQFSGNYSFVISRVITPQIIESANASYLCSTINPYGLGEIFTVDINNQTLTAAGSSYTAIGKCNFAYYGKLLDSWTFNLGLRLIANKEDLSGKTSIIKNKSGAGATVSSSSTCYKIATAGSYYVVRAAAGVDTQEDQSNMYAFQLATNQLVYIGNLQCVIGKDNQPLADSYDTGVIASFEKLASGNTTISAKIYVLYNDSSISISSYSITITTSGGSFVTCPMKISSDGKNVVAYRPYLSKTYTGSQSLGGISAANGLPADDAFIVPENRGTKKIEAVGVIYESGNILQSGTHYPCSDIKNGTFLILEPKT